MDEAEVLGLMVAKQCAVSLLTATQQYILAVDGCSKADFLEKAGEAYDATEGMMRHHVETGE